MAGVVMRRGEGTQERMSCEGGDRDCGDAATNQGALRRAGSHERLADTRESLWRAYGPTDTLPLDCWPPCLCQNEVLLF